MLNLSMPIELIVSIINTYLRSKYSSLEVLCEIEDLDFEELTNKLSNNNTNIVKILIKLNKNKGFYL